VLFDKATGENEMTSEYIVFLAKERIDEDKHLDRYYVICTNVTGLAKEIPFNVTKNEWKARLELFQLLNPTSTCACIRYPDRVQSLCV